MNGIKWLESLKGRGIKIGLERMDTLMAKFFPDYRIVHVGGTNGKGSVCQFVGSILQEEGFDVGIYSSPHLERLNERITINGTEISDDSLNEIAEMLMEEDMGMTFFEAMTAIALIYFRGKIDFAVIEVGMGGRYDATNIVNADVTVITNISMEHEKYLGRSIEEIAGEKSGIIKGGSVVTACTGDALRVIEEKAREQKSEIYVVGRDIKWKRLSPKKFLVEGNDIYELQTNLSGIFQGNNIAVSVKVAEILGIKKRSIVEGIRKASLPGRMERAGMFLLDGAHNPAGIEAMGEGLKDFTYRKLFIIFGAMKDKDIESMVKALPEGELIATAVGMERAADTEMLSSIIKKAGKTCICESNVENAIKKAMKMAGSEDLICITGSLYLVGEARRILKKMGIKFSSPL